MTPGHPATEPAECVAVLGFARSPFGTFGGSLREAVRAAGRSRTNTIPPILSAVRANATVGEICQALADVWGRFDAHHP